MPAHDYSPKDALKLLLASIAQKSEVLAARIQTAIDAGQEVQVKVEEPSESGKGRKRKRKFWKTQPFSDEEALDVALTLLESHLIESRMMLNKSIDDFRVAGQAPPKPITSSKTGESADGVLSLFEVEVPKVPFEAPEVLMVGVGEEKTLTMEIETERLQEKRNLPDIALTAVNETELDGLQAVFAKLEVLLDFKGGRRGDLR